MYKTFEELGFKEGDTVKCTKTESCLYVAGKSYNLTMNEFGNLYVGTDCSGYSAEWELVKPVVSEFKAIDIYSAYLSSRAMTERLLLAYSDKTYEDSDYNLNLVKEELVELTKRLEVINIKLNSETV